METGSRERGGKRKVPGIEMAGTDERGQSFGAMRQNQEGAGSGRRMTKARSRSFGIEADEARRGGAWRGVGRGGAARRGERVGAKTRSFMFPADFAGRIDECCQEGWQCDASLPASSHRTVFAGEGGGTATWEGIADRDAKADQQGNGGQVMPIHGNGSMRLWAPRFLLFQILVFQIPVWVRRCEIAAGLMRILVIPGATRLR
jgi:hypothetical protein